MREDGGDPRSRRSRRASRGSCRRARHWHRKERILHTRISEPLAEDIRRMAEDLRLPVSNLVRNVLEEAFSVVEAVSDNVGDLIEDVVDEAQRTRGRIRGRRQRQERRRRRSAPADPGADEGRSASDFPPPGSEGGEFPEVVGWQPLILNLRKECADCGGPIESGERGFAGMGTAGFAGTFLCRDCMGARR